MDRGDDATRGPVAGAPGKPPAEIQRPRLHRRGLIQGVVIPSGTASPPFKARALVAANVKLAARTSFAPRSYRRGQRATYQRKYWLRARVRSIVPRNESETGGLCSGHNRAISYQRSAISQVPVTTLVSIHAGFETARPGLGSYPMKHGQASKADG